MSMAKQTGPAQPDKIERQQKSDASSAQPKDAGQDAKKKDEDLPGAEGPLSAGANEDTYD